MIEIEIRENLGDGNSPQDVHEFMMDPDNEDYVDLRGLGELVLALIKWIARQMKAEDAEDDEANAITMPKFASYELKERVIEWLKSDRPVPGNMIMRSKFKELTAENMNDIKTIYKKRKVITETEE